MSNQVLRFGLVGYGLWGQHHARAIAKASGARLAAIADATEANRKAAAEAFPEAQVVADWRELTASRDLDVVDVVVPSHLHYEIAKAALDGAQHVLVEKPMVLSVRHADELIALACERGRMLAVDHEMRLSALWGKVKELVDAGAIGLPQYALLELSRFPYRPGTGGWRYDIRRVGNWILEEPIHFIDLARWYMAAQGEPETVYARASSRQPDHPELQDNFSTIISFGGGGYAVVTQTLAAFEHHCTCKVCGTTGAIWAHWSAPDARSPKAVFGLRYGNHEHIEEVAFPEMTGEVVELQQQIDALVRAINTGSPPAVSGSDGRWAVRMCLAAQASVERGLPVKISEVH